MPSIVYALFQSFCEAAQIPQDQMVELLAATAETEKRYLHILRPFVASHLERIVDRYIFEEPFFFKCKPVLSTREETLALYLIVQTILNDALVGEQEIDMALKKVNQTDVMNKRDQVIEWYFGRKLYGMWFC